MSYDQQSGFPQQPGQSPYEPPGGPPPKKKSNTLWIVLGVIGGGSLLLCLCCGGCSYMLWNQGTGELESTVSTRLQGDAKFAEHFGNLESCSFNFSKSMKYTQDTQEQSVFAFDVTGSKGSGVAYAKVEQGTQNIEWIKLELPSGELIEL